MALIKGIISRLARILFLALILFLVLFTSSILLIRLPEVQTEIVQRLVRYAENEFGVKVRVAGVYLNFSGELEVQKPVIFDCVGDSLFYCENLKLDVSYVHLTSRRLLLDYVSIEKPVFTLVFDSTGSSNIVDWIQLFGDDTTSSDMSLFLKIYGASINEGTVNFSTLALSDSAIASRYLPDQVTSINLVSHDIVLSDSGVSFLVDSLLFYDVEHFQQVRMIANGRISSGFLDFDVVDLSTGNSSIHCEPFKMQAVDFSHYSEFVDEVRFTSTVKHADISLTDLHYFASPLPNETDTISFNGKVSGTVNDFRVRNCQFSIGDSTYYNGSFELMGVTDPRSMFFYTDVSDCRVYYNDLISLPFLPEKNIVSLSSIKALKRAKYAGYQGRLTGYPNDFVSEGSLYSTIGTIESDVKIATDSVGYLSAKGRLWAEDCDLSYIARPAELWGEITASIDAEFKQNASGFSVVIDADISNLEFKNYFYTDLFIDVAYQNDFISLSFVSDDPNFQVRADGQMRKTDSVSKFYADIEAETIGLSRLGLFAENQELSTHFVSRIDGWLEDPKQFNISALFPKIAFESVSGKIADEGSRVQVVRTNTAKYINLQSEYLNLALKGDFDVNAIEPHLTQIANKLMPSVFEPCLLDTLPPVYSQINCFSDSLSVLISVFLDSTISCSSGFDIDVDINSRDDYFTLHSNLPQLTVGKQRFENIGVFLGYANASLEGDLNIDIPLGRRSYPSTGLSFFAHKDTMSFDLEWKSDDTVQYNGSLSFENVFYKTMDSLFVKSAMRPALVTIADTIYQLSQCQFTLADHFLALDSLFFSHGDQLLQSRGILSNHSTDTLFIKAEKFNLGSLNPALNEFKINAFGSLSGELTVAGAFGDGIVETKAQVDDMVLNDVRLGSLDMFSTWEKQRKSIDFNANAKNKNHTLFDFSGSYLPKTRNLELEATVDSFDITFLDPFLSEVLNLKTGWLRGYGFVSGNIDSLTSTGQFYVHNMLLKANYLNTMYMVNGPIGLYNDRLVFQNLKLVDYRLGRGTISGYFSLFNLPELDFDLILKSDNLLSLNTQLKHNDLFYGQAASSGTVRMTDKEGELYIAVGAEVAEGSKLYIPLNSSSSINASELLRFTSDSLSHENRDENSDLISMDINLAFTPKTEIQLILDEQVGDIIKASGQGDIAISIDANSKVTMMGEYNIVDGEYLFTMMNLLNKRFKLLPSSAIYFSGELDDAIVDIQAVYSTKTNVRPIMGDVDSVASSKRTKVDCILSLTGELYNPQIKFDIDLPEYTGKAKDRLASFSEDEQNRQFLSLLVLNRFSEPEDVAGTATDSYSTAGGDASVNSMEVLSNQFSNWLSGISKDFDFGVNYRPGDQDVSDEIEVGVSTQILDDRISIEYNRSATIGSDKQPDQRSDNYVGDVNVELKLTKNGKLRLRGFSRESEDDPLSDNTSATNGVGISYTDEFDTFRELFTRGKNTKKPSKDDDKNLDAIKREDEDQNE